MDHLAKDLTIALEESESCGPISFETGRKWGMRRRARSAGNLRRFRRSDKTSLKFVPCSILDLYTNKSGDNHSDDSSSSNSEANMSEKHHNKQPIQSDSDELSLGFVVARAISNRTSLRLKNSIHSFFRGRYSPLGDYFFKRYFKIFNLDIDFRNELQFRK